MRPSTLAKLIPCIQEGPCEVEDIMKRSGLGSLALREVLAFLEGEGIARLDGATVSFGKGAKVLAAVSAVKLGLSSDEASKYLRWRDFEDFLCRVLLYFGHKAQRGFRLRNPRAEIDVLAVKNGRALAIDGKHWHRSLAPSSMARVIALQIRRAEGLARSKDAGRLGISHIIPIIVTLYGEPSFFNRVPIVPVGTLSSFLLELDGMLDTVLIISV